MNVNMRSTYPDHNSAPDFNGTNNNGLWWTADILEEIYTNASFPVLHNIPALNQSMKESGKSRADLWAFAGLVAAQVGIEQNNLACQGKGSSRFNSKSLIHQLTFQLTEMVGLLSSLVGCFMNLMFL